MRATPVSAVLAGLCAATTAAAQSMPPLRPGEIIFNGLDHKAKVLACRPVAWGRECEVVAWKDDRPDSNPAWSDEKLFAQGDARARAALGLPPRGGAASAPARATGTARQAPAAGPAARGTGGRIPDGLYECRIWIRSSYVSLGTVRSVGGKLSPDLVGKTGGTVTGASATAEGLTISYTTARGYRESMDCKRR